MHAQVTSFARRQAGCTALARELSGVGPLVAAIVWAFLGDTRRFSSSAQAVRHTGMDVTVGLKQLQQRVVGDVARPNHQQPSRRAHQQVAVPEIAVLGDHDAALAVGEFGDLPVGRAVRGWTRSGAPARWPGR